VTKLDIQTMNNNFNYFVVIYIHIALFMDTSKSYIYYFIMYNTMTFKKYVNPFYAIIYLYLIYFSIFNIYPYLHNVIIAVDILLNFQLFRDFLTYTETKNYYRGLN
jgi:hypothetical protein